MEEEGQSVAMRASQVDPIAADMVKAAGPYVGSPDYYSGEAHPDGGVAGHMEVVRVCSSSSSRHSTAQHSARSQAGKHKHGITQQAPNTHTSSLLPFPLPQAMSILDDDDDDRDDDDYGPLPSPPASPQASPEASPVPSFRQNTQARLTGTVVEEGEAAGRPSHAGRWPDHDAATRTTQLREAKQRHRKHAKQP